MKANLLGFLFILIFANHHFCFGQTSEDAIRKIQKETLHKDLVVYGEASHDLQSNHDFACTLFKSLVLDCGYRVLFLEVATEINNSFQQFISEGKQIDGYFLNAFNSPQVNSLLEWIKNYNIENPADPVYVCGFQPEQPVTDVNSLRKAIGKLPGTLDSLFSYDNDLELVIHNSSLMQGKKPIYSSTVRKQLNEELSSIPVNCHTQLSIESLRGYINVLTYWIDEMTIGKRTMDECAHYLYQEGDSVRMNLFEYQKDACYKNKKAFLWMHNWHAMKNSDKVYGIVENGHPPVNTMSFGYRIFRRYDSAYFLGTVSPSVTEDAAVFGSIDKTFSDSFGESVRFISLDKADEEYEGTLLSPNDKSLLYNVSLKEQFDGIIYLPNK